MNIITGKFKGRKLISLETEKTRPTLARVKESVFNIIADKIEGKTILDLFAGSGALGIECLSRGAKTVYFNDANPESKRIIEKNLKGNLTGAEILNLDYVDALMAIKNKLDLVFLDPPYASDFGEKALYILVNKNKLNNGATIVFEHSAKNCLQNLPKGCIINKMKSYGEIAVSFISFEVGNGR